MTFKELKLSDALLANIEKMAFQEPSPIQAQVMPAALEGGDVSGLARTGTGKTAAFLIPTIERLSVMPADAIALCLAPTRELASQIEAEAMKLGAGMNLPTVCVVGGMSADDQIKALKNGARIVVGTPGRVIDLFKERALDLSKVEVLVFDEADRMFDMGFIKDMQYLLGKINPKRQIMLFSATMNFTVLNMVYEFGANPKEFNISRDQVTAEGIKQVLFHVGDDEKPRALISLCHKYAKDNGVIIVFVNYKEKAAWVAGILSENGIPAESLSSLMRQEKRNKIIQGFREGKFRALVATDVASRGLDIEDVSLVVNYHLPEDAATYVHRIGRTARAGKEGIAVNICSSEDAYNQMRVEEFLNNKIPVEWLSEEDQVKDLVVPSQRKYMKDDFREERDDKRGPRPPRGEHPRGPRPPRPAAAESRGPRIDRPQQEARAPREVREPREHREHRNPRDRSGREHTRNDKRRNNERPLVKAPADLPSPLTGNPIIYCMKTGKPKNRSEAEMTKLLAGHSKRVDNKKKGPAIMKKLSSKMSSLFGAKRP